jgi:hypothetical protein
VSLGPRGMPWRVSGGGTLLGEAARIRRRRAAEFRAGAAAVLLCAGLSILPALAALDVAVWAGCHSLDTKICVALFTHAITQGESASVSVAD